MRVVLPVARLAKSGVLSGKGKKGEGDHLVCTNELAIAED
jgi:hypothetical protein